MQVAGAEFDPADESPRIPPERLNTEGGTTNFLLVDFSLGLSARHDNRSASFVGWSTGATNAMWAPATLQSRLAERKRSYTTNVFSIENVG